MDCYAHLWTQIATAKCRTISYSTLLSFCGIVIFALKILRNRFIMHLHKDITKGNPWHPWWNQGVAFTIGALMSQKSPFVSWCFGDKAKILKKTTSGHFFKKNFLLLLHVVMIGTEFNFCSLLLLFFSFGYGIASRPAKSRSTFWCKNRYWELCASFCSSAILFF